MASRNLSPGELIPLATLSHKVSTFAALCDPDYRCDKDGENYSSELFFMAKDYDADPEAQITGTELTLSLEGQTYLPTDWCFSQLLTHLGVRKKWYEVVALSQFVDELNARRHTFDKHRFRRMRTPTQGIHLLRGLVSNQYAEISDTLIMEAVTEALPNGFVLNKLSGKSDRAFYGYIAGDKPIGTKDWSALPGAVFRNSEVGFTSLWITPYLLFGEHKHLIVLRDKVLFRRAHRGNVDELRSEFKEAQAKLAEIWGPLQERLDALQRHDFGTEDAALARMTAILKSLRITNSTINACTAEYTAVKPARHSAAAVFGAVLRATAETQLDLAYEKGELAGLFLFRLI